MCSHYVGEKARAKLSRLGVSLPAKWEAPPGSMHVYPTQLAPIIRRLPERNSGNEAAPNTPEQFGRIIKEEVRRVGEVAKAANIRIDP